MLVVEITGKCIACPSKRVANDAAMSSAPNDYHWECLLSVHAISIQFFAVTRREPMFATFAVLDLLDLTGRFAIFRLS
jgi:hypothetical protein